MTGWRGDAARGEPARLAIVDRRSPATLTGRVRPASGSRQTCWPPCGLLQDAGVVVASGPRPTVAAATCSCGWADPHRRPIGTSLAGDRRVVFCTHNSARSQLAAASAGPDQHGAGGLRRHPSDRVHPGAVAAGRRHAVGAGPHRPHGPCPAPDRSDRRGLRRRPRGTRPGPAGCRSIRTRSGSAPTRPSTPPTTRSPADHAAGAGRAIPEGLTATGSCPLSWFAGRDDRRVHARRGLMGDVTSATTSRSPGQGAGDAHEEPRVGRPATAGRRRPAS